MRSRFSTCCGSTGRCRCRTALGEEITKAAISRPLGSLTNIERFEGADPYAARAIAVQSFQKFMNRPVPRHEVGGRMNLLASTRRSEGELPLALPQRN